MPPVPPTETRDQRERRAETQSRENVRGLRIRQIQRGRITQCDNVTTTNKHCVSNRILIHYSKLLLSSGTDAFYVTQASISLQKNLDIKSFWYEF